jgi:hypothetical protein
MATAGGTNKTYFHGTSLEAALSIQQTGFEVSRSGTNARTLLGAGIYFTTSLVKAMHYATKKPHGGCIFHLEVDRGNCLELQAIDDPSRFTKWQILGYDSVHAPEGVLYPGSMEEFCLKDPTHISWVAYITLCDTRKASAAGYSLVEGDDGDAGPPAHCKNGKKLVGVVLWLSGP